MRRWLLVVVSVLGISVVAGSLAWILRLVVDLEASERQARGIAAQEEKVRLALWRMDSALTTFLAYENARSLESFEAASDQQLIVARRFEISAQTARSKNDTGAPPGLGGLLLAALSQPPLDPGPPPKPAAAASRQRGAPVPPLLGVHPPIQNASANDDSLQTEDNSAQNAGARGEGVSSEGVSSEGEHIPRVQSELGSQAVFNQAEFRQRSNIAQQQSDLQAMINRLEVPVEQPPQGASIELSTQPKTSPPPLVPSIRPVPTPVEPPPRPRGPTGVLRTYEATWLDGRIILARRVVRDGAEALQAMELDNETMRNWLQGLIVDLLPTARLQPVRSAGEADPGRTLALLPYRLDPGPVRPLELPSTSPARLGLWLAFGSILLVGLGTAALALASWRLGRRRSEFASAVIHELRTPLTTFRLYTDMLAEGVVPEAERSRYFETLRHQADRLGNLVENVLAYARLERRGASPEQAELLTLGPWLRDVLPRLDEVTERAGLRLELSVDEAMEDAEIRADRVSLERILDNLCDNSCKYAADGGVVSLSAGIRGSRVVVTWRDHGPGVPRSERRTLFTPFRRGSAARSGAGSSVEGIGLGLALSRRLARRQGGELAVVATARQDEGPRPSERAANEPAPRGAAFELLLPLAGPT